MGQPTKACFAVAALLCAGLAAACSPGASAPPAAAIAAPVVAAPPPQGSGCGPDIARTQAVVDSDLSTGNLNQPVGERFSADLRRAADACRAGREREGLGLLAAAKSRYGYR